MEALAVSMMRDLNQSRKNEIYPFYLIWEQFKHWQRHMHIIYGFIIADTGMWPYVLNMEGKYPVEPMPNFY